jgi:hypothetical protein
MDFDQLSSDFNFRSNQINTDLSLSFHQVREELKETLLKIAASYGHNKLLHDLIRIYGLIWNISQQSGYLKKYEDNQFLVTCSAISFVTLHL